MIASLLLAQERGKPIGNVSGIGGYVPWQAGGSADASTQVDSIFTTVVSFLTIVGGLAFLIYFLIGALNWILAGGNEKKVEEAKSYMTNGAIGLIIIIASYSIISIIGTILGLQILSPGQTINNLFGK